MGGDFSMQHMEQVLNSLLEYKEHIKESKQICYEKIFYYQNNAEFLTNEFRDEKVMECRNELAEYQNEEYRVNLEIELVQIELRISPSDQSA